MSAYRKLAAHTAKDANGDLRLILVYQSFDEVDMPHGVSIRPSAIYFETADHQEVNWLNPQQFEIEATGEILNRVPPFARGMRQLDAIDLLQSLTSCLQLCCIQELGIAQLEILE
jgi:hypothetical protein